MVWESVRRAHATPQGGSRKARRKGDYFFAAPMTTPAPWTITTLSAGRTGRRGVAQPLGGFPGACMSEIVWFMSLFGIAVFGLLLFAIGYKLWEVRGASRWRETPGRILESRVESRERRKSKQDARIGNYPRVVYEYRVGGRRYQGRRIGIGEEAPDFLIQETLDRYPAGAVVKVYYNPDDPKQAVLERDLPAEVTKGLVYLLLFLGGGGLLALFWVTGLPALLAPLLPTPGNAPLAAILAGMSLFTGLLGWALRRQGEATRRWPMAPGEILSAGIETHATSRYDRPRKWHRYRVVYSYPVGGRTYSGDRIAFGPRVAWSAAGFLMPLFTRRLSRYQAGQAVCVYYNPDNPAEAVLERGGRWWLALWVLAGGLLLLAASAGGLLR